MLAACKAANIYPVIISSVGSSSWGANQFDLLWTDIESHLFGSVFNFKSIAVSLGGDSDIASELDPSVRGLLKNKIISSGYNFIFSTDLQQSIDSRMSFYNSASQNYKAYISIGGSVASLGDSTTMKMYLPGLNYQKDPDIQESINNAYDEDLINNDTNIIIPVIENFNEKLNIPVINIRNINNLCDWYGLPYYQDDYNSLNMKIGFGELFGERTEHHLLVVWFCLFVSLSILIWIVLSSIAQVNKKMEEIHKKMLIYENQFLLIEHRLDLHLISN